MPSRQKPDIAIAGSSKRLASRFYQLKTSPCLTGQYLTGRRIGPCSVLVVPAPDADTGSPLQGVPRVEGPAEGPMGRGAGRKREGE